MTDQNDNPISPIMEWLVALIDDRIVLALEGFEPDELELDEIKAEIRTMLENDAVVTYGGDIGFKLYEDGEDGDGGE